MITAEELQIREVVKLYELEEDSYRESAGGTALSCGCSEPVDCRERVHGLFAKKDRAIQKLDSLVEQRTREGYSRPNCIGGEQTRVERGKEGEDNKIFCTSIIINILEVDRREISEKEGKLKYQGVLIE